MVKSRGEEYKEELERERAAQLLADEIAAQQVLANAAINGAQKGITSQLDRLRNHGLEAKSQSNTNTFDHKAHSILSEKPIVGPAASVQVPFAKGGKETYNTYVEAAREKMVAIAKSRTTGDKGTVDRKHVAALHSVARLYDHNQDTTAQTLAEAISKVNVTASIVAYATQVSESPAKEIDRFTRAIKEPPIPEKAQKDIDKVKAYAKEFVEAHIKNFTDIYAQYAIIDNKGTAAPDKKAAEKKLAKLLPAPPKLNFKERLSGKENMGWTAQMIKAIQEHGMPRNKAVAEKLSFSKQKSKSQAKPKKR